MQVIVKSKGYAENEGEIRTDVINCKDDWSAIEKFNSILHDINNIGDFYGGKCFEPAEMSIAWNTDN